MKIMIPGAFLNGELIKRHMALLDLQRLGKLDAPLSAALVRARIDHVERDAREYARGNVEGVQGLSRRVLAPQGPQICVVQRMYSDRETVYSSGEVASKILRLGTRRIGL